MPRPIQKRTRRTFQRDVEALGRLRTAVRLDEKLPQELIRKLTREIDALVETLSEAIRKAPVT